MNCLEFRRLTLIDPDDGNAARLSHQDECPSCTNFAILLLQQDELVREASRLDVPEGFAARILLNQTLQSQSRRPTRWFWLSLAASFLLGAMLLPSLYQETFSPPLGENLVTHVSAHNVLSADYHNHVTEPAELRQVLASVDTAMPANVHNVLYAATCVVDGEVMAHLLVEDEDQQYVVFLIPERTLIERSFQHANWSGELARLNNRSIAVMNKSGESLTPATSAFARQFSQNLSSGQTI